MDKELIYRLIGVTLVLILGMTCIYYTIAISVKILYYMITQPLSALAFLTLLMSVLYFFFKWRDRQDRL